MRLCNMQLQIVDCPKEIEKFDEKHTLKWVTICSVDIEWCGIGWDETITSALADLCVFPLSIY